MASNATGIIVQLALDELFDMMDTSYLDMATSMMVTPCETSYRPRGLLWTSRIENYVEETVPRTPTPCSCSTVHTVQGTF